MSPLLKQIFLLSPLWSLSIMAFVPLAFKLLNNKELKRGLVCFIYALSILISMLLFFIFSFNNEKVFSLHFDSYSSASCVLVALSALISLGLIYLNAWIDKKHLTEILFFFSQGVCSLYIFCLAQNLMTVFIGIEIASLVLYVNLAMSKKEPLCLEAAIKYFVLSALSSVVFLYGLSFLFGGTGTLDLNRLFIEHNESFIYNRFFFLGFSLVFASLFFKAALFPFQFWLADVYQGALTPMTSFMATGIKSAVVLFLGKLFSFPFFEKGEHAFVFLTGLALASVLTVLFGSIMALNQKNWKRLAAFSSLSHSGYFMMLLFGILNTASSEKNFSALFYYLLAYIFLTGGLLASIQCLEKKSSQSSFKDSFSLFKRNPFLAFCFAVFLLGLAGMPPSFGFFGKVALFQGLISSGSWWLLFWAFVGSAIGLYYYIKPVSLMLNPEENHAPVLLAGWAKFILILLLFFSLFGAFIFGQFFYL